MSILYCPSRQEGHCRVPWLTELQAAASTASAEIRLCLGDKYKNSDGLVPLHPKKGWLFFGLVSDQILKKTEARYQLTIAINKYLPEM